MYTSRRRFMQGCCSAIAAMSGSKITGTMFDQGSPVVNQAMVPQVMARYSLSYTFVEVWMG